MSVPSEASHNWQRSPTAKRKTLPLPNFLRLDNEIITITYSDADYSRCPPPQDAFVSPEGTVDYVTLADAESELSWKRKIATGLVEALNLCEHEEGQQFVLSNFPEGYRLYVHRKGSKDSPRKDFYLYGSKRVHAFRSPNEFVLHAHWLADGGSLDGDGNTLCQCKYCGNIKSQSSISPVWMGLSKPKPKPVNRLGKATEHHAIAFKDYTGIGGAAWKAQTG